MKKKIVEIGKYNERKVWRRNEIMKIVMCEKLMNEEKYYIENDSKWKWKMYDNSNVSEK